MRLLNKIILTTISLALASLSFGINAEEDSGSDLSTCIANCNPQTDNSEREMNPKMVDEAETSKGGKVIQVGDSSSNGETSP